MPRRNLQIILAVAAVSFLCYQRVEHNAYARYLGEVLEVIDRHALEPVDAQKLFDGAMDGIVSKLDPFSSYTPPEDKEEFVTELEQNFAGVGVEIRLDEGDEPGTKKLIVRNPPMPDTPAERAGIEQGDHITRIDGQETARLDIDEIVHQMRGPVGTNVVLEVRRPGVEQPLKFEITRALIEVPSVIGYQRLAKGKWNYLLPGRDRIGYIQLEKFGSKTVAELQKALHAAVDEQHARAIVLDLRDDPGGLLEAAVGVCELFLKQGQVIVSIRGRAAEEDSEQFEAESTGPFATIPLAILINGMSASASEIVAACLQDQGRAKIVGTRSYGKGTVQHVIEIQHGRSILKLTAASYWRPSDVNIHKFKGAKETDAWGVRPDPGLEVKLSEEEEDWVRQHRVQQSLVARKEGAKQPRPPEPPAAEPVDEAPTDEKKPQPKTTPQRKPVPAGFVDRQLQKAAEWLESQFPPAPAAKAVPVSDTPAADRG